MNNIQILPNIELGKILDEKELGFKILCQVNVPVVLVGEDERMVGECSDLLDGGRIFSRDDNL